MKIWSIRKRKIIFNHRYCHSPLVIHMIWEMKCFGKRYSWETFPGYQFYSSSKNWAIQMANRCKLARLAGLKTFSLSPSNTHHLLSQPIFALILFHWTIIKFPRYAKRGWWAHDWAWYRDPWDSYYLNLRKQSNEKRLILFLLFSLLSGHIHTHEIKINEILDGNMIRELRFHNIFVKFLGESMALD